MYDSPTIRGISGKTSSTLCDLSKESVGAEGRVIEISDLSGCLTRKKLFGTEPTQLFTTTA